MINEKQEQWLSALESGDYQQGQANLRNADFEYCCLGVLCDLVSDMEWVISEPKLDHYTFRNESIFPPPQIANRFGLQQRDGSFRIARIRDKEDRDKIQRTWGKLTTPASAQEKHTASLSMLNDNGWTFEEIADLVRRNPHAFFV